MPAESIATLTHQAAELLAALKQYREPLLTTQDGLVLDSLIDAETVGSLQARVSMLRGLLQGEKAVEEGRTLSHGQARMRMAKWLA